MSNDETNNLELWNSVCTTDAEYTKYVNQRGGFTAICAQYQLMTATDKWGPYGRDWGVRNLDWSMIEIDNKPVECVLEAEFYYPVGAFHISTCCLYKPGNDTRKKLLTDLTTKALSKLGFNADVFLNKFDDNKYVNDLKSDADTPPATESKPASGRAAPPRGESTERPKDLISVAQGKLLYARVMDAKIPDADMKKIIKDVGGVDSSRDLPWKKLDAVLDAVGRWQAPDANIPNEDDDLPF